jgi:hypothetical protein
VGFRGLIGALAVGFLPIDVIGRDLQQPAANLHVLLGCTVTYEKQHQKVGHAGMALAVLLFSSNSPQFRFCFPSHSSPPSCWLHLKPPKTRTTLSTLDAAGWIRATLLRASVLNAEMALSPEWSLR